MFDRAVAITVLSGSILLLFTGCGGRLYKVTPLPAPPAISMINNGGLEFGAVALDSEQSYERFEANLPLAGVIAVDVRMVNNSNVTIMMKSLRFELLTASGADLKRLIPKKALAEVMKYYGDNFYTKLAYQRTLEDYESVALKNEGSIGSKQELRGIVFFKTKRGTTSLDGLTLSVAGLNAPLNIEIQTVRK